ncbi:MAG: transglycosylase domain-containing protein [Anaerolineae bacterium]|nr:transglycosylase domain-containing protein [Anaerolineae bacterium]
MRRLFRFATRTRRRKILTVIVTLLLISGGVLYAWLFADLPSLENLNAGLALPATRIYDRNGQLLYEILPTEGGRNTVLPLDAIPRDCVQAVIATEDASFYTNPGVDPVGVLRALWINLRGGEVIAGGSTITQQVARNLLLDPEQRAERTLHRKLREMILAVQLGGRYSKDEVLALYLNQVYFGNLAYGIEGAARAFFGKAAAALSRAECALLAGLLQNPAAYNPLVNREAALERQQTVLRLMVQNGYLTQAEADAAQNDPLQFAAVSFPIKAPHAVMAVWEQLAAQFPEALYSGGLEVTTTIDLDWTNAAQRIVQQQLDRLNHPPTTSQPPADAHNAALVALDPFTGQVLVMLGSPDYFDESIDGNLNAAYALRQPGSTLKPFTYAAAFDPTRAEPWTAATMLLDVETPFVTRKLESYTPANFALVEHGPVLIREALASSFNIPAVTALEHVGLPTLVQLLGDAGVETLARNTQIDLAVTLGGGEVRLADLTQAYSIFANGGYRVEPSLLLHVTDHDGRVLYEWSPPPLDQRVLDERVAWLITDILSDNHARIPSFGPNSALNIGRPAAAKTGTTTDYRDNWVIGYTPNLVTGVWVGNADNRPMVDVTGVSGAAPIWNAFMREALLGQPELTFAQLPGLEQVEVCALSGLLPTPACPHRVLEWFIPGSAPTQTDTFWQTFAVDTRTGFLADESTPPEFRQERNYAILPQEARDWAARNGFEPPPRDAAVNVPDATESLRLLEPDPYTVFQVSPQLPIEAQRLRLTVGAVPGTQSVGYYLNGALIGTAGESPWAVWWPLAVGDYELVARARLGDGTEQVSEAIPFRVVAEPHPP